eukprot:1136908-Pelagomonas_calceolata.AAC.7
MLDARHAGCEHSPRTRSWAARSVGLCCCHNLCLCSTESPGQSSHCGCDMMFVAMAHAWDMMFVAMAHAWDMMFVAMALAWDLMLVHMAHACDMMFITMAHACDLMLVHMAHTSAQQAQQNQAHGNVQGGCIVASGCH